MKKKRNYIFAAGVLVGLLFLRSSWGLQKQETPGFQGAEVIRVVDGDTLLVDLNGESARVRLIGVDCEESVMEDESLNTERGRQEAQFVKNLLPEGTDIYLQKDVSETDQYGRLLRYVWLEIPENAWDVEEVRTKMLNGILVDQMHTQVKDYPPDVLYSDLFWKIQKTGS